MKTLRGNTEPSPPSRRVLESGRPLPLFRMNVKSCELATPRRGGRKRQRTAALQNGQRPLSVPAIFS
jgi:hypothetical protein